MRPVHVAIVLLMLSGPAAVGSYGQINYIWWEGENPSDTNFPSQTWFSTGALESNRDLLSEGNWLTNEGTRTGPEAYARYTIEVPVAGEYNFWVRKFWKHGPFRWRFDEGEWQTIGRDIALADSVEIRQHLSVNWVSAGVVTLPGGPVTSELRLLAAAGESLTACFDCFLLTPMPFVPRGKLRPDEQSGEADEGFFAWEPALDPFAQDALFDLRYLNEETAGQNGFVQRDGDRFTLGDGTPVRFWAVNASSEIAGLSRLSLDHLARRLAKLGVNMVRYHSPMFAAGNPDRVDPRKLDNLFYLIAALKREGIYTKLSFYFPLWFDIQPGYGIPGYDTIDNKRPFALLYFDSRMQEIYKSWARGILQTANPYTGVPLAEEPAVAIVEIINEDSYFFWTFSKSNIPHVHWRRLEELYSQWLIEKYGSVREAIAAWNHTSDPGDDADAGIAALYEAWHMTGAAVRQAGAGKVKRVGDQVRFLTEHQRAFYQDMRGYFKNELGSGSLVSASNWHVSDASMLDALERYTYTAGDVIDRHGYFSAQHSSPDGSHSYAVRVGHDFGNLGAVTVPERLPLQFVQIDEYPHIISEIGWTNPNLYRADYSFLASAYGSLQGIDGLYAFALGGAFWDTSIKKFALSCPAIMGNFPAYALMYRRGDVAVADPVLHQVLDLEDLYAMKGSGGSAAQALDELRQRDVPPGASGSGDVNNIDPLSFYVGRVQRAFGEDTESSTEMNLEEQIDRESKTVTSLTGELVWNWGTGLVTIDTPKCQGVAGFLHRAGEVRLGDVAIESDNEYGTIVAISLDDRPLAQSSEILLQAMTVERPYGFRASNGRAGTITELGSYPFGIERIRARITITLQDGDRFEVLALDANGYPTDTPIAVSAGNDGESITFDLAEDSVYHLLRRNSATTVRDWRPR